VSFAKGRNHFITALRRKPEQNSIATMIQITFCENILAHDLHQRRPLGPVSPLEASAVSKSFEPGVLRACRG
jgi:hypothetical protein